jgi:hypothetical protein
MRGKATCRYDPATVSSSSNRENSAGKDSVGDGPIQRRVK